MVGINRLCSYFMNELVCKLQVDRPLWVDVVGSASISMCFVSVRVTELSLPKVQNLSFRSRWVHVKEFQTYIQFSLLAYTVSTQYDMNQMFVASFFWEFMGLIPGYIHLAFSCLCRYFQACCSMLVIA